VAAVEAAVEAAATASDVDTSDKTQITELPPSFSFNEAGRKYIWYNSVMQMDLFSVFIYSGWCFV
jgi:hypothetical protein